MAFLKKHKEGAPASVKCAVITISDSRTAQTDESGKLFRYRFQKSVHSVLFTAVLNGMRPLKGLISFDEAQRIAIDFVRPLRRTETVPFPEALHRVAAEDVRSAIDVPLADRSAMDGYAVLAEDTKEASETRPAA